MLIEQLKQLGLPISINQNNETLLSQNIHPLVLDSIINQLSKDTIDQLDFLPIFLTLDSTNQHLKNTKVKLANRIRICLTEHQSSGRGRQSKQWVSPLASNIYLSLHARLKVPLSQIGGLSLVAGISIIDGLNSLGVEGLKIKWPNDVYWDDKKLAGILIESTKMQENSVEMIIGIGININMPKTDATAIDQAWVDLNGITGNDMCRNSVIAKIIDQLIRNINKYRQYGLQIFMSQWQELDYLFQKDIILKSPDGKEQTGNMIGINERGELLMNIDNQIQCIHAGDISVRKV